MDQTVKFQDPFSDKVESWSRANRKDFMCMLLRHLTLKGLKNVNTFATHAKSRKKFSFLPTKDDYDDQEDGWWEMDEAEKFQDDISKAGDYIVVGYIKGILPKYRENELQNIKSSMTWRSRMAIVHPEKLVSRLEPVPSPVGWWHQYGDQILSVDCEMVSYIIGTRIKKGKVTNRCKQLARTVSVCDKNLDVIYRATIFHEPKNVYLTPVGKPLAQVQEELDQLFRGKLLILANPRSDFEALEMSLFDYDIFDIFDYWIKGGQPISLKSLVIHYFKKDIQAGVHNSDTDAIYTMRLFLEKYVSEKSLVPEELQMRTSSSTFDHIQRIK